MSARRPRPLQWLGEKLWGARASILRKGLAVLCVAATVFGWLAWDQRRARQSYEREQFLTANRLLAPWFRAGLLGREGTQILLQSLIKSAADPKLTLDVAESCTTAWSYLNCAVGIGVAYRQLGLLEQAEGYLVALISRAPESPEGHFELGEVASRNGKVELAVAEYAATIGFTRVEKDARVPTQKLVQLLNANQRYSEAGAYVDSLFALSQEEWPDGLYTAAETYLALKNDEKFLKAMKQAEELNVKYRRGRYDALAFPKLYQRYRELRR